MLDRWRLLGVKRGRCPIGRTDALETRTTRGKAMTTLAERIEAAHGWLRGFVGLFRRATFQCEHEWGDDEDFVSCYETTIGGLENGTHIPITIQTRQWCLKCDATRRKPGSARPALRARESQP